MTVGVLMLAAGSARRFGSDKRRALLPDGRSLLQASADSVLAADLPLALCLRPGEEDLLQVLPPRSVLPLYCDSAGEGMGATLAQGVAQLPPWRGALIALADMPWIRPRTLLELASLLPEDGLCRPICGGKAGHPVGFGRAYFGKLAELRGDTGARDIVAANRQRLVLLECDDAGVLRDVDRVQDLG